MSLLYHAEKNEYGLYLDILCALLREPEVEMLTYKRDEKKYKKWYEHYSDNKCSHKKGEWIKYVTKEIQKYIKARVEGKPNNNH
jgi:hypothetical protein